MDNVNTMVVPFSNGTDAGYWHERNCEQCSKYEMESQSEEKAGCLLAYHMDLGFMLGEIPRWAAERIGILGRDGRLYSGKYVTLTQCKEKVDGKEK